MTITDILAWIAGIGSLLYFAAAMIYPTWFIGDERAATPPTTTDEETLWHKPLDFDDWQHVGQPR